MAICPHCGNTDRATIEDNGCKPSDPRYTLLCVAPCKPDESSFDERFEDDDRRVCGMQWEPV